MVTEIVTSVLSDNTNRRITIQEAVVQAEEGKTKKEPKKRTRKPAAPKEKKTEEKNTGKVGQSTEKAGLSTEMAAAPATGETDLLVGRPCPVCGKGTIIKGKTAYGCSEWRNGCTFRKPFD